MKRKPGKPHVKALHQPIPELVTAEGMPEGKRRTGYNRYRRYRRDNRYATIPVALEEKIAWREKIAADRKGEFRRLAKEEKAAEAAQMKTPEQGHE